MYDILFSWMMVTLALVVAAAYLVGWRQQARRKRRRTVTSTLRDLATAALAGDERLPWQKDPGPIAGRWSVTCEEMARMVVEFSVDGRRATGALVSSLRFGAPATTKEDTQC